ncbi:hypothetical protein MMC30_002240 [Trapelia coarctata]|nr:hypothetical protein [Trapelia coarctata]
MGNCFGKPSAAFSSDPFAQPGRTLGNAPPAPRASVPPKISSQRGKTLGAQPGSSEGPEASDARRAAAKAAEERAARANQPKGKLGQALASQKQQTRNETLGDVSREERRNRDADEGAEARNWN